MTHNSSEDSRLVRQALDADRRSFEQIVRRYQTLICSITRIQYLP